MSLRLWTERGARAGALLVAACGLLALGIHLNGHGQLLALGLPGASPITPGSALGFLLAGLAVAAMGRPPGARLHARHAALPLLAVSAISLVCVFALPQVPSPALVIPPLPSLSFALVAGAALRFDPRAGRGMACAVVAAVVGAAACGTVVLGYAAWWLQNGERLLLGMQAPQAAVLQMVLALAIGGLCLAATAEGTCRRHAAPLAGAGVTAAGLVAAWALILGNDSASVAHDVEQRMDSVAQSLLEHVHRSLDPADLILRQVADRIRRQGLDRFGQSRQEWEELAVAAASLQQISALVVLDHQGRVMSYSARFPPALPGSFALRDYFLAHRRGDITFLGPLINTAWGQRAFTYSRRVSDRDGNFAGVVVATLEPDYFRGFYRSLNLGPGGAVSLWRSDGRLLLREPTPADLGSADLRGHPLFTRRVGAGDGGSFVGVSPFDHDQRFVGYRVSTVHPLVVMAAVSAAPLARGFERRLFASALLLTLALAALARATAQQLSAPRRDTGRQAQLEAGPGFTRAVLDSVAATVAIVDREGRIVDANKAWARFAQAHGAGPDARNGLDVLRRAGAADRDGVTAVLWGVQAVMRGDLPWSKHHYECTGAAESRWYKVRITPLEGADGCVVISQEDVTDLKRAEMTQRREQAAAAPSRAARGATGDPAR
ncbi:cache domain-containing protein [uncultured Azohydromonas sp.]|uniref:cache domain-containing protein n=1 Tax=uncultured Azohydromonas sp. TaxID=487342 RepID=UPI00261DFAE0|nr:cache domain-containing protein [uncultured Azohydromonas sp.]